MKKSNKFLIGMVAVIMLLSTAFMGCIDGNGDVDATIVLGPSGDIADVGGMVYVNVVLATNSSISGAQFNMEYNPDIFIYSGSLIGESIDGNPIYSFYPRVDIDNGNIEGFSFCTLGEGSSISGNESIIIFVFIASHVGVGEFKIYDVIVGDSNGEKLDVDVTNTQIEVI